MKILMLLKWLPWKFIVRRVARSRGFLDPIALMTYLRRFAQPSDVSEPIELLRAGMVLHARGLVNSRAIQHNLDWVWPYWVERQFNPEDDAFIPRAFSITHINLTHRNWTALGLPNCPALPIVDPRGLLTPFLDGWSIDAWILTEDGRFLTPSRLPDAIQRLNLDAGGGLSVTTDSRLDGLSLVTESEVLLVDKKPVCQMRVSANADAKAWLVIALRPYNPEGISFVHDVAIEPDHRSWKINGKRSVEFSDPIEQHSFSHYRDGDVFHHLPYPKEAHAMTDEVGMATAAVLYELEPGKPRELTVSIDLAGEIKEEALESAEPIAPWPEALREVCALNIPDPQFQFLYDAAIWTLILHSPGDVYPGPYTYKRFWFRDAAFILEAMMCAGMLERAERVLDRFPSRQTATGYFHSQEGEWDSNGEALWVMNRFCELSGRPPKLQWHNAVRTGARWIRHKRFSDKIKAPHAGLFPAGFSAEHLGLNDYYFWDDFWGVAGLRAAAAMLRAYGDDQPAELNSQDADAFMRSIERSLESVSVRLGRPAMPASPYRRLDAGVIGSLAAGYPLRLFPPDDPRLTDTAHFLIDNCFLHGGFFQDMIHSGINPYLSLHVAQVLLRAGDRRFLDVMRVVAELASPTGQWPEAIHPRTKGGCMGDGQHVWAAAEWVMMIRNCFMHEEENRLILCAGLPRHWCDHEGGRNLAFGPAPTAFGKLSLTLTPGREAVEVAWRPQWHGKEPPIEIRLAGFTPVTAAPGQTSVQLKREAAGAAHVAHRESS